VWRIEAFGTTDIPFVRQFIPFPELALEKQGQYDTWIIQKVRGV
jgi:hypothetical protein